MVVFEIAGATWPLDDRTAEALAVAFRLGAAPGSGAPNTAIDDVNTTRGLYAPPTLRMASKRLRVPSRLMR